MSSSRGINSPVSSGHGHQTRSPCIASGNYQPTSPTSPSDLPSPASSRALSRPASNSSGSGSGSGSSAPPTPQSPFSVILGTGTKEGAISPDTIHQHYMSVARRLSGQQRPDRPASPDPPSAYADTNICAIPETEPTLEELAMIADSAQAFDWSLLPHWTLAGTMTLDELPDSATWSLPEYQLTQEWYEQIVRCLREAEGETKASEAEMEAEMEADSEVGTNVEMEGAIESMGVKRGSR
ncbi:hypothetical protein BJV78DRAFT_1191176 [Lactifluus subvellereus]|nr:hypothetical protein BJV78DRAFT_1191176 [Lactifluus subvellereus]